MIGTVPRERRRRPTTPQHTTLPGPGGEDVQYTARSAEDDLGSPNRPSLPLRLDSRRPWESGSYDLRQAAADIADALSGRSIAPILDRDGNPLLDDDGVPLTGGPTWYSVWLRTRAEAAGRVTLSGRSLPANVDEEVRRKLLGPDPVDELIGYRELSGEWRPGAAGLSEPERDAVNFWLSPNDRGTTRTSEEIRDLMDRRRKRYGMRLQIDTVDRYLRGARQKLRALAETPGEGPNPESGIR